MDVNLSNLIIPKFLDEAITPIAREIGQGFGDLFNYIFSPFQKLRIKKDYELQQFALELKSNIESIPEEKLVEPPLHIVGPTLEASKYYYEEKDLRDMFAKLIASSMNSEIQGMTRSTFVEIIKQMEPLDAIILKELFHGRSTLGVGQVRYLFQVGDDSEEGFTLYDYFFPLTCLNVENREIIASSITNIIRLGLITIYETVVYKEIEKYAPIVAVEVFKFYQRFSLEQPGEVEFMRMAWSFTPLGYDFVMCCLPQSRGSNS